MPRKPESLLTARILKALRDLGGWWIKVHGGPYQTTGVTDIIGCYEGLFFGLEVKLPKGKLTPRQALVLSLIKTQGGGVSGVVTGPEEAVHIVKQARYSHVKIYSNIKWLSTSQAQVKAGLLLGKNLPVSRWKLQRLVDSKTIKMKSIDGKSFYNLSELESKVKP